MVRRFAWYKSRGALSYSPRLKAGDVFTSPDGYTSNRGVVFNFVSEKGLLD